MSVSSTTPPAQEAARTPVGIVLRLAALVYDGLLLLAIYFITMAIVGAGALARAGQQHAWVVLPDWYRHFVMMPSLFLVTWLFYGYFWHQHGQTLGMQTWRLQTLRDDDGNLRWVDGLRRMLASLIFPVVCGGVSGLLEGPRAAGVAMVVGFVCNYLWIYANAGRLAWHDQLSSTRVWRVPPKPKSAKRRGGLFGD